MKTQNIYHKLFLIALLLFFSTGSHCKTIYVSYGGSDTNQGTFSCPVKTIAGLERIISNLSDRHVTVVFSEGSYSCLKTFNIPPRFSSFIMKAAKGAHVEITGSCRIDASMFKPVTDSSVILRIKPEARNKVLACNLRDIGITDYGDYFTPSPYGAHSVTPLRPLLLVADGRIMPISQYPNDGWMKVGRVSDRGSISKIDGFREPNDTTNRGGTFAYFGDEPKRWAKATDVWLSGFFYWGWYREQARVSEIDTLKHEFRLASALRYGIAAADNDEPEGWAAGRFSDIRRFYAFNLLEEIDRPGEWYLDRSTGILYWWPVDDYKNNVISVIVANEPLICGDGVSNATVSGLHFVGGKSGAIVFTGGKGNTIESCSFYGFRETAVVIRGNGNHVENCNFSDINGAVVAEGGNRRTLQSGQIVISDCMFNRYTNTAVDLQGVGTKITHCEFHNADNSAISFKGNDHIIEYCVFDSIFNHSGDDQNVVGMGRNPSYQGSVIRYNLFSNIGKQPNSCQAVYIDDGSCGVSVFGNVFYRAGSGKNACVYTNGGSYNHFENNIFIDNPVAYHLGNCFHWWAKDRLRNYLSPGGDFVIALTKDVDIRSNIWRKRYPLLYNYFDDDPATPKGNTFINNVVINSAMVVRGDTIEPNVRYVQSREAVDNYLHNGVVHTFSEWKQLLSEQQFQSDVLKFLPKFRYIPFSKIGNKTSKVGM